MLIFLVALFMRGSLRALTRRFDPGMLVWFLSLDKLFLKLCWKHHSFVSVILVISEHASELNIVKSPSPESVPRQD